VDSFWVTESHGVKKGVSRSFCAPWNSKKLCETPCPKQKEATDHNFPPPAGNYVFQPRCVGTVAQRDAPKERAFGMSAETRSSRLAALLNHFISAGRTGESVGFGFEGKTHTEDVAHCFLQRYVGLEVRIGIDVGVYFQVHIVTV
jgi:hypothetical protein